MEETLSLKEIMYTLRKYLKLIVSISLLFLILSSIITFFIMAPQYEASTQILVNQSQNESEQSNTTDIESSRELINTYDVIITSPNILESSIENSEFNGTIGELQSKINVEAEDESQVATITVEDDEPRVAVELANTIAQTFEQQIPTIMNVDNVSILSTAQLEDSNSPISPQPIVNLGIALIVGLLIGVFSAFLLEFLDKSLKDEQDIERELKLPILGVVPIMKEEEFKTTSNRKRLGRNPRSNSNELDKRSF